MKFRGDAMSDTRDWQALNLFNLYRVALSGFLVLLSSNVYTPTGFNPWAPNLFSICALVYFALSLISGLSIQRREAPRQLLFRVQILIDLVLLCLLSFAIGNPTDPFGYLLVIPVAFSGYWQPGRMTQFYSALAILGLLTVVALHAWFGAQGYSALHLGALGAVLLAIGLISGLVGSKVAESQSLARERELDLDTVTELNARVVRHMEDGMLVIDNAGYLVLMNPSAARMMDLPENLRLPVDINQLLPRLQQQLNSWRTTADTAPVLMGGISIQFAAMGRGRHQKILVLLEDKEVQSQALQKEKLAALGRLTASLAHEIRNPLGAISQSAQLLAEAPALGAEDRQLLTIIQGQSRRLNTLVEDILKLSRQRTAHEVDISLADWLGMLVDEWRRTWPDLAQCLELSIAAECRQLSVTCDPGQVRQIITILLENAQRHGVVEGQRLELEIYVGRLDYNAAPYIEVKDNGPGIPSERQGEIFEPFFTTHGSGTGLGLFLAQELASANHCTLRYSDNPEGGSCFRLNFPTDRPVKKRYDPE
ncbi:MAG: hypothetical protein CMI01_01185 [Oceanospirillaceae bacterium]|nr:hypothetical protein [Oceanospirillaceae bacterium]